MGSNPHRYEVLWEEQVNRAVGSRVHSVIAELAATGEPVDAARALDAVRNLWKADPIGGSVAASARVRCSTAVSSYFLRFAPPRPPWELVGSEVRVGAAVADLVWRCDDVGVVIDEVKSGAADAADPSVADQLQRLADGGAAAYDEFVGVRLVPLGSPARSVVVRSDRGTLRRIDAPAGMGLR